ncbi:MAG: LysR family transcriptional regulator [Deltaproteobacteria bacterium]|nr:LysR family transcriptional regulator [Deltaproteobacteria bacterium]
MQGSRLRWDDVQVFLALHRERSLARAAVVLGLDASTLSRRLTALESALTLTLFDRGREGLAPTEAASQLLATAEAMELAAAEFSRDAEGFERQIEGRVRVSTMPGVADSMVAPRLGELLARHPKLTLELDVSVGYADLSRREADLALRGSRPTHVGLIARRLVRTPTVIVASPGYARALGTLRALGDARWITYAEDLASQPSMRWLAQCAPQLDPVLRTSSFSSQMAAARAGVGVLLAPAPFVDGETLVRVKASRAIEQSLREVAHGELWLVGHRALRTVPRVSAVWDWLASLFEKG